MQLSYFRALCLLSIPLLVLPSTLANGFDWKHPFASKGEEKLKKFSSCQAMEKWLEARPREFFFGGGVDLSKLGLGIGQTLGKSGINVFTNSKSRAGGAGGGTPRTTGSDGLGLGGAIRETQSPTDITQTNNQIANVDEGDLVKTDGKYLYQVSGRVLHIVKMWPAEKLEEVAFVTLARSPKRILLVSSGKLLVVSDYRPPESAVQIESGSSKGKVSIPVEHELSQMQVFDVSIPAKPTVAKTYIFSGLANEVRLLNDNMVVLILKDQINYPTLFSMEGDAAKKKQSDELNHKMSLADWLGKYSMHAKHNCENFYYRDDIKNSNYVRIVQVNLANGNTFESSFFGAAETVLLSDKSLYMAAEWNNEYQNSVVNLFSISAKSEPKFEATGSFKGSLINSFAMDEFDKVLRLAVHTDKDNRLISMTRRGDGLYLLGKSPPLGKGQGIKSARFIGDTAYVVTFKTVDPLYILSLKDPSKIMVIGELHTPGYSSYIHPIANNRLLTVGKSADTKTGRDIALKVSLFDVSDKKRPKLVDTLEAVDGTRSMLASDHHAFTYSSERRLLAVPIQGGDCTNDNLSGNDLSIFKITHDKIEYKGNMRTTGDHRYHPITRSLIAEDYIYALSDFEISIADAKNVLTNVKFVELGGNDQVVGVTYDGGCRPSRL